MNRILSTFAACLFACAASALPVGSTVITVTQKDGTTLSLRLVGDEHFHYYIDTRSGQRMTQQADGSFCPLSEADYERYAQAADERRASSNVRRAERLQKIQRSSNVCYDVPSLASRSPKKAPGEFKGTLVGQRKGLVILVNFADRAHSTDDPQKVWNAVFNEEGYSANGHIGSVHDYFKDQSYGLFDLTFDVVGPVTVSESLAYYGQNANGTQDLYAGQMIAEACTLADASVNFKDYDWDGDGEVDQVYVIYAGFGESSGAPSETIWPHEYWLQNGYGKTLTLDGVKIDTYACSCELRGRSDATPHVLTGIGTACHEFSHCVGFPDFYNTSRTGVSVMGQWEVLDAGSYNGPNSDSEVPVGYTAYERWMAGWLEPTVLSEGCDVSGMKDLGKEPEAYVIYNEGNKNEYFLLENRQQDRWFTYPGGHGLFVTHVDYDRDAWMKNRVNADTSHPRMSFIPAGKSYGTYASVTFPGSMGVTELTNTSHKDFGATLFNRNTDGTYRMNHPITDIAEAADGTISFCFDGGTDTGERWTVTFDAGTGSVAVPSLKQDAFKASVTLPEATIDQEGWSFMGWTTSSVSATTEAPEELYLRDTSYQPTADITLYAVYGFMGEGTSTDTYTLVNAPRDGRQYVFATQCEDNGRKTYALNAEAFTSATPVTYISGTLIEVDYDGSTPSIHNPASGTVWTASVSDDEVTLRSSAGYLTIQNTGLSLSSSPCYLAWDNDYGLFVGSASLGYYLHVSSGKFNISTSKQSTSRVYPYEYNPTGGDDIIYASRPDGNPEGVRNISTSRPDNLLTPAYDLQGRRTNARQQGVYIQNSKKIIK